VQVRAIPGAAASLVVACFDSADTQFAGLRKALAEMARAGGFAVREWSGGPLALARARSVRSVILCGHGSPERAGLGDGCGLSLAPADIRLRGHTRLYLLGCHQGREDTRLQWARGTGVPEKLVRGAEGETETLLSTLFLLHCADKGIGGIEESFDGWVLSNRLIRPRFEEARALYARTGGDPLAVLDFLERALDLASVGPFLALARRRPEFLTGLVPRQ